MAATRIIEEEHGTFVGTGRNPHQGYYAGDFTHPPHGYDGFALAARYAEGCPAAAPAVGTR